MSETNINESSIWKYFKNKGLSDFAVAGIMGNLYAESGLNTNNLENYYENKLGLSDDEYTQAVDNGNYDNFVHDKAGYGLAQWTFWSRKEGLLNYAKSLGVSISDLEMQLNYLWQELIDSSIIESLKSVNSVKEASNIMLLEFERPADQSERVQNLRASYSQEFYEDYALSNKIDKNEAEDMKRYNTLAEIPEWAKTTITRMINQGILKGNGNDLDLSEDMLRMCVIFERWIQR